MPNGVIALISTVAPPPNTKNPKIVLIVPFTVSAKDLRWAINPTIAIIPTSTAGTFKISTKNLTTS